MSTTISPRDQQLRHAFRWLNRYMLLHWRLGLGPYANRREISGQIMLLVHVGRKTGRIRRTPVNYAIVEGDVYCLSGFGPGADWYRNLQANPQVEIWLPHGWWAGTTEDISDTPERLPLLRQVLIASGFAARLAGLDPVKMTDENLDAATRPYRLVRIRRTHALTGPGGPGDLAWVWPAATAVLLGLLLLPRRHRR
ncbi:MAG: nitroreductase family deazaflavin-dependent oxidoreductase [Anaerolineales bacterium]|nr:nitroreductase family deazaflavin-dependent oxidoreductase [Anaerolineales bacterium]